MGGDRGVNKQLFGHFHLQLSVSGVTASRIICQDSSATGTHRFHTMTAFGLHLLWDTISEA